jgi:DNA-binding response OmpR family regulator
MRLLLVEDDVLVASGIKLGLSNAGYAVDWVGSAERALEVTQVDAFDIAVIDIGLPVMDGLALTQALRDQGSTMPMLILTARDALQDRVQGLDRGADDYMVKPFELPELLARLRALLRRSQAATSSVLRFGVLELDMALRRATVQALMRSATEASEPATDQAAEPGQGTEPPTPARVPLELGPREWTVMEYLMLQAPKPANKDKLLQALTGWDKEITPNAVEVYISRLRAKLEPHGIALRSIRGFGYRLERVGAD